MSKPSHIGRTAAAIAAVAGAAVCLWWGLTDHGIFHPDEIYQTLEQAHRLAYGYGLTSWEWRVGARNWTLPAMLSAGFGFARLVGLDASPHHLVPVTVATCVATAATSLGVYRLARTRDVRPALAVGAAVLFAFSPVTIYFGHRAFAEVWSAPFVVWGLVWTLGTAPPGAEDASERLPSRLGLSLLGVAVLVRLHTAVFAVFLAALYRVRGTESAYERTINVLTVWALVYGLLDFATWGLPFQSAAAYLRANLWLGVGTDYYGVTPVGTTGAAFLATGGLAAVVMLVGTVAGAKRAPYLTGVAAGFLLPHLVFPHQEFRFVFPGLPLLAALAGVGAEVAVERFEPSVGTVVGGVAVVSVAVAGAGIVQHRTLTFGDLREHRMVGVEPDRSAHRFRDSINRLLVRAGRADGICGLFVRSPAVVHTGGATYLHRDVPIYHRLQPPPKPEHYNFVLLRRSEVPDEGVSGDGGAELEATRGDWALVDTGRESCEEYPDYKPRIDREKTEDSSDSGDGDSASDGG